MAPTSAHLSEVATLALKPGSSSLQVSRPLFLPHRTAQARTAYSISLAGRFWLIPTQNKSWFLSGLSHLAEIKWTCPHMDDPNDLFLKNIKVSHCGFALISTEKGWSLFPWFFHSNICWPFPDFLIMSMLCIGDRVVQCSKIWSHCNTVQ